MKRNSVKLLMSLFVITIAFLIFANSSNASQEFTELNGRAFYIKNAYTGHYLDVAGGVAGGTNVQQYEYNGSDAQKWYVYHVGNGEYMIYTYVGSTLSNNTLYLNYALDVDNGINANGTEIHIWNAINGNTQLFTFTKTTDDTYIIWTKASNNTKVASLADNLCSNGIDVHQWEYSNHSHDQWILEPVDLNITMGVNYARANYDYDLDAYPSLENFGGDCTNFVSQCLLAAGSMHQDSTWYIKRINTSYHDITTVNQLNYSWSLADPSPWISANEFKNNFYNSNHSVCKYKGSYITQHCGEISMLLYNQGDVIQIADNFLGLLGSAHHSMYVVGYSNVVEDGITYPMYNLAYQSTDTIDANLYNIASNNSGDYFLFYDFTN